MFVVTGNKAVLVEGKVYDNINPNGIEFDAWKNDMYTPTPNSIIRTDFKMDSFLELIKTIEQRPAMYISRNYISCLKSFIDGWYLRETNTIIDLHIMGDFQEWIAIKYKVISSHSWADILLFYSQDEGDALKKFFQEFNKFLELKII